MKVKQFVRRELDNYRRLLTGKRLLLLLLGTVILSFGMINIHRRVGITEGGVLGLVLLIDHHFGLPPWLVTPVLDGLCYLLGWKYLGTDFIRLSLLSTTGVSICLRIWERVPFLLPDLTAHPLAAALLGGVFVGVGVGLIVRQGGSSGGDDALALVISQKTKLRLSKAYLFTDLTVLILSLTYIPLHRIAFSLVTVTTSSMLIDPIQSFGRSPKKIAEPAEDALPETEGELS